MSNKFRQVNLEVSLDWEQAVLFSKYLSEQDKLDFSREFYLADTEDLYTFSINCQAWRMIEVCTKLEYILENEVPIG